MLKQSYQTRLPNDQRNQGASLPRLQVLTILAVDSAVGCWSSQEEFEYDTPESCLTHHRRRFPDQLLKRVGDAMAESARLRPPSSSTGWRSWRDVWRDRGLIAA